MDVLLVNKKEDALLELFKKKDGFKPVIEEVRQQAYKLLSGHTAETEKGRKHFASVAYKVARSKTYIDDLGKNLVADAKKQISLVDAERKSIKDQLDLLKSEIRKPVDEFEKKEKERVEKLKMRMSQLESFKSLTIENTLVEIQKATDELTNIKIDDSFGGFKMEAERIYSDSFEHLVKLSQKRKKLDDEQLELENLRKEKELKEQKEREEKIKKEAEERARKEEQEKIKAEKEKAQKEKIEAENKLKEAERRAKEAEQRAIEELKRKQNAEKEEEKRRAENVEHQRKINRQALDDLMKVSSDFDLGIDKKKAMILLSAIVNNKISNVSLKY